MASPGVFSDPDPKAWVVGKDLGAFWGPWDETPLADKDQGSPGRASQKRAGGVGVAVAEVTCFCVFSPL